MRLNVWMRLAIVATVLWLIGGTIGFHMQTMNQRNEFAGHLYKFCIDGFDRLQEQYPGTDYSKNREECMKNMTDYYASETPPLGVLKGSFLGTAIIALLAWVLGGIVCWVTRWVLRGRQRPAGT